MTPIVSLTKQHTSLKFLFLILPVFLLCATGCAQNDHHNFNMPGKIPIDAKRWYQLTNASSGLDELFDQKTDEKPNTGYNKLVTNYDSWYPLLDGEQMTIDSIMFYCWRCIDAQHPVTIYAILADWKRVPIATFTGARASTWEGPDPHKEGVFALAKPISGIRYLVINSWGEFPAEIEFYGPYTPPKPLTPATRPPVALSNFFGINAYEWDFEDPKNADGLEESRLNAIKNFTGVRHYLDWDKLETTEGNYAFNPSHNGGWNYDTIYHWCQAQHIEVLACLKTIPKWMENTYPEGKRNAENVPARYGKDLSDPASYIEQSKLAFQFAARYGANKIADINFVTVDTSLRWKGDHRNEIRIGLGLVKYMECDNERDKWWKNREAYQTGREYAANLSAFYDGHKGKLGQGTGVKNADSKMKVVMGGLANPDPGYLMGMIDWSRENRGYLPYGSIDLPWDIINYHYYCNDANGTAKEQNIGVAPELTSTAKTATDFITMAHRHAGDMPVWVTETGYDINGQSTQRATVVGNKNPLETQADWTLRSSLLFARAGVQRVFIYQLNDDNATSTIKYGTSGLINIDRSRRPAAVYLDQVGKQFGAYHYAATLSNDPLVDLYENNGATMFVLTIPDSRGRTGTYQLDLGKADTAYIYTPKSTSDKMELTRQKTTNGKVVIKVTETPVFVTGRL